MNNALAMQFIPLVLLIVVMYFLLIRPQKKKEKQVADMRNSIKVGDDIVTIGGIYGKVVKVKDERLTIQVGADKTKFEITRWAVSKIENEAPKSKAKLAEEEVEGTTKKALPKKLKKLGAEKEILEPSTDSESPEKLEDNK
ncbi:preprotein translocase subunit YajC [Sinanaerobacter sp. ZZT-01]|uniref:preprotein translocase subunit YajC n=1 Tax=Sinanaerobacter sp. ZZT-01 TaxID=3111540 RepID=UPI002D79CEB4|nr:preprotein translocase subunit YajC [Sinanaerobacter sp. ZZT-01]WRR93162.1 preprotein translocase subunit YajC [Sinanaerobacter sp. ZZT-01]